MNVDNHGMNITYVKYMPPPPNSNELSIFQGYTLLYPDDTVMAIQAPAGTFLRAERTMVGN